MNQSLKHVVEPTDEIVSALPVVQSTRAEIVSATHLNKSNLNQKRKNHP